MSHFVFTSATRHSSPFSHSLKYLHSHPLFLKIHISFSSPYIDAVNAIEDDADVESRKMKLNGHVARLALLFQV